jgi:hypothetical protein
MQFVKLNRAPDGLELNINPLQVTLVTGEGSANATVWFGESQYLVDKTAAQVISLLERASIR